MKNTKTKVMMKSQPYKFRIYAENSIERRLRRPSAFNMRQGVVPLHNLTKQNICIVELSCLVQCMQKKKFPVCCFSAQMFIKYIYVILQPNDVYIGKMEDKQCE